MLSAERTGREITKVSIELEIQLLEAEDSFFKVDQDSLELKQKLLTKMVKLTKQTEELVRDEVTKKRAQEIAFQKAEAKRLTLKVSAADPTIRAFAEENERLAILREKTSAELEAIQDQKLDSKEELETYTDRFERTKLKSEAVGGTNAIGMLLRKEKDVLPSVRELERSTRAHQKTYTDLLYLIYQNEEKLQEISDLELIVSNLTKDKQIESMSHEELVATVKKLVRHP